MKWLDSLLARFNLEPRPPATTFAEGQQALMVKLLARSGMASTIIVLAVLAVLIWAVASPPQERLVIYIMAGVIAAYALANMVVIVSFSIGGPVGRIDLEATRNGLKMGAAKGEQHDEAKPVEASAQADSAPDRSAGQGPPD